MAAHSLLNGGFQMPEPAGFPLDCRLLAFRDRYVLRQHALIHRTARLAARRRNCRGTRGSSSPRQESNLYLTLRRRVHYPLCYEEPGAYCSRCLANAPIGRLAVAAKQTCRHLRGDAGSERRSKFAHVSIRASVARGRIALLRSSATAAAAQSARFAATPCPTFMRTHNHAVS